MRSEDDALRLVALDRLGPHAPALARAALEEGSVEVEADVLAWEGSAGTVHAHRVILVLERELAARVQEAPSAVDALTAALAAAVARAPGNSLAALEVVAGEVRPRGSPYRGRF